MRFPSTVLQQIKERVSPDMVLERMGVEVSHVGGGEVRCQCPIHRGDGDNFSWDIEDNTWTCFSRRCGEDRGVPRDVFLLVMLVNGIHFASAVSLVASWVGMSLGDLKYDKTKEDELKISMWLKRRRHVEGRELEVLEESMMDSFDFTPHTYMLERGFSEETLSKFEVGYATTGELEGRIVVPIRNKEGELVGFSGRLPYHDVWGRKYKNYSDFRSGDVIYGLNQSQHYVKKSGSIILVEGFFDVLRGFENGVYNVGATMGTSITDQQIKLLVGLTDTLHLAYDGDKAGRKATERVYNKTKPFFDVKILNVSEGRDFGDYNALDMLPLITTPLTFLEWKGSIK